MGTSADIAIYGGAAFGGKTWALLAEPMRDRHVPGFRAVTFRRKAVDITKPGSIWDQSMRFYPHLRGRPRNENEWGFASGMTHTFGSLQHNSDVYGFQGTEIPYQGWDELTQFSAFQFWYMLSRLRSMSGIPGRVRASCNPDPDSFVAELIAWWINQETGYPIPERAGVLRWFIRYQDELFWADRPEELWERFNPTRDPNKPTPKSLTFVPARAQDNRIGIERDPSYIPTLLALPMVERERLLGGNWKIRPAAGRYFKKAMFPIVEAPPRPAVIVRGWDLAATEPEPGTQPCWTVGIKLSRGEDGLLTVEDMVRDQVGPGGLERLLKTTATQDTPDVEISIPQDPGQAGKFQAAYFISKMKEFRISSSPETGDKVTRAGPASSQAQAGNIRVVRGPWNDEFFRSVEAFPMETDVVDALSRAYAALLDIRDEGAPLVWSARPRR